MKNKHAAGKPAPLGVSAAAAILALPRETKRLIMATADAIAVPTALAPSSSLTKRDTCWCAEICTVVVATAFPFPSCNVSVTGFVVLPGFAMARPRLRPIDGKRLMTSVDDVVNAAGRMPP